MDLQQIRYVVLLSQELHFLRASKKANVSQPTLSQQIQKLERELGTPLFERSPRNVRLTAQGKKFLPHAIAALDSLQKGVRELADERDVAAGIIRLGVIPTICPYLLPGALARLARIAPLLKIELHEETTPVLVDDLKSGRLDLAILALPLPDKGVSVLTLRREPFFVAVSRSHRLADRKSLGRKDLLAEKLLILREGHCFGQQSMDFCKISRQDPQITFEGGSLASVMAMAELGQGITFVPQMAVPSAGSSRLKFIPLLPKDQSYREIGIAWRLSSPLDKGHRVFMETVGEALRGLSG